jgi:hypothetical protein
MISIDTLSLSDIQMYLVGLLFRYSLVTIPLSLTLNYVHQETSRLFIQAEARSFEKNSKQGSYPI